MKRLACWIFGTIGAKPVGAPGFAHTPSVGRYKKVKSPLLTGNLLPSGAFLSRTGVQLECGHSAPARMATAAGTAPETPPGASAMARGRLAFPDRAPFHSRYHNHRIFAGSSQ